MGFSDWFSTFCSNLQVHDGGTMIKAIRERNAVCNGNATPPPTRRSPSR